MENKGTHPLVGNHSQVLNQPINLDHPGAVNDQCYIIFCPDVAQAL